MPARRITAAGERRVRQQYIATAKLRRELIDVEVQIADLMQRRADLRAEIAAQDVESIASQRGVSKQVIISIIRPRSDHALAP